MRETAISSMWPEFWNRLWERVHGRVSKLKMVTLGVLFLCVIPLFFLMQGQSFDLSLYRIFMPQGQTGLLTHAVLVLLGGGVALFSSTLAFLRYRVRRAPLLAVIGLALFWSGLVDLAQVLVFDKWMYVAWRVGEQTPLGWTLSRFFSASILVVAAGIVLHRIRRSSEEVLSPTMLIWIFLAFGAASVLTVLWLVFGPLPDALSQTSIIKRPWDIPALIVLLIGTLAIFPRLHRRYQSTFSYALWLCMVPLIAAQCYVIFYSTTLFDGGYLVAYGLILLSFIVLSGGLGADYMRVSQHEQRLMEELRVREARIRAVLENASEAIIMVDRDFRICMWNSPAEEMFGWSDEEALGRDFIELVFGVVSSEPRSGNVKEMLEQDMREQFTQTREVTAERRGGESFVAEYTIAQRSVAAESGDGDDRNVTFFIRDKTEQYQLRLRMIQMDRLITVGTLAAGVGHELSNPLTYVLANLEMARGNLEQSVCSEDPELVELAQSLDTIELGLGRILGIVQDLKLLSSFQETKRHPVSLQEAAQVATKMTRHLSSSNATLVEEYEPVPPIMADEARLTQVFINLLTNAVQALPQREASENRIVLRIFCESSRVIAEVEDNGLGMTPEIRERIFEQFFTTKDVGKGTGLGLALCNQIVESFEGRIEVDSTPGMGSTFRLVFPIHEDIA